jgi:tetratricopeptide (TPR) repeat protein
MNKGDLRGALSDFDQAIELKPDLGKAYAARALTRYALDDTNGAESDALRAIELEPSDPRAYIVLGRLALDNGLVAAAAESFDRAVAVAPDRGDVYWWRGRFLTAVGEYRAALEDLSIAVELAPSLSGAYLDRAVTILQGGADPRLARPDLEEAIERADVDPKNPSVRDEAQRLLDEVDAWVKQQGDKLAPLPTPDGHGLVPSTSTPEATASATRVSGSGR